MPNRPDARTLVRRLTQVGQALLVPELSLHLITPEDPMWWATPETLEAERAPMPYWAFAWPGGQALARYLLDHPDEVRGKRVLDFGCGGAIEGLAAKRAGARSVLCADIDPLATAAAQLNAELNRVAISTTTDEVLGAIGGPWEVVLAGDMLYEVVLAERILGWLQRLAADGATVLIGDPGRVPVSAQLEVRGNYQAPFDGDPRGTTLWTCRVARVLPV